jgi:hypothetical protein
VPAAAGASVRTQVPAAASTAVSALLARPVRPAEVVGSYPAALYLGMPDGVLALETPAAVRLPNSLTLHPDDHATVVRHAAETPVRLLVGGGGVRVGDLWIAVGRWWNPVPALRVGLDVVALRGRLDRLRSMVPPWPDASHPAADRLAAGTEILSAMLGSGSESADRVARALVGLGPGLTPAGDDVLAGAMAGLVIFGWAVGNDAAKVTAAELAVAVARRAASTTALAADLARYAASGAVAEPVAALCHALAGQGPVRPAVENLLSVGHTSGRDLVEGLLVGGQAAVRTGR